MLRKGAFTPTPPSFALTFKTCPSLFNGSVMEDKPIKSISSLEVEIKIVPMKSVSSGVTSSKQSQCCVPAQFVSSSQSTPVSEFGRLNTSIAKTSSTEIKTMIGTNRNGIIIRAKINLCLSVRLFFSKKLGSSLSY